MQTYRGSWYTAAGDGEFALQSFRYAECHDLGILAAMPRVKGPPSGCRHLAMPAWTGGPLEEEIGPMRGLSAPVDLD